MASKGTLGTSEDFSRVYFVDTKPLTPPTEENANGEHAEEGKFNLYLTEGGATTFIGILEEGDEQSRPAIWSLAPSSATARPR